MTWVTVLLVPEDDPKRKKVLEACQYCQANDPTFQYQPNEGIKIFSQNKNQAYKRGMYFHKKFGVYFEVYWQK